MEKGIEGNGKETTGIGVGASRSHIPEDVLIEILKRLPKKSLCRFRCVSTTWLSLISSSLFESSRGAHWRSSLMMLATIPCGSVIQLQLSSVDSNIDLLATDRVDIAKTTFKPWLLPGCISSSVGGLICLDYQDHAEVCNPTTKELIILPKLPRERHLHIQRTSLCFDPIKNQHKVLRSLKDSNVDGGVVEHHVFIPGASRWRKIKDNDRHERFGEEVCVDGVLYGRAIFYVGSTPTPVLVAFDVHAEIFDICELPDIYSSQGHNGPKLVEYFDGGIADVYCPHHLGSRNTLDSFYLAFMEGVYGHWTYRKIALPSREVLPRHGLFYLMGSLRNGELLAFIWNPSTTDISYSFFFYDAKNDVFWKLAQPPISIPRGLSRIDLVYVSDYVENPAPMKAW
ncbi:hypothetical protein CDL15_Pgr020883 [Punica granatum]|uniref:F-box domain-containing protein n=1 Tax=Punica granatum TaxID=22663 RepID=A0A218XWE2_PUNGR|nr:hypothetical protein CDL15_Pgr020880 [Punica granatum]OWM88929.1 hypothetical protein CDL15_Pgr020883 [Punica granatum]